MKRVMVPAVGFLLVTAVMLGISLVRKAGLLDAEAASRALGVCLGLMAVVTGNFLPKMRPLGATTEHIERVAGAERRAGWMLVIMGLALVGLFLFAPLVLARWISTILTLGGVGLIEADWIWTAWISHSRPGEPARSRDRAARERRTVAAWLFFGLAYVLVTAGLKFIAEDSSQVRALAAWSVVGFSIAYSLFYALIDFRRRGGHAR